MRLNPITCDLQTSKFLQAGQLTKLYIPIENVPVYPVRYDGKEFSAFNSNEENIKTDKHWWERRDEEGAPLEDYSEFYCPFGAIDDLLWVQEAWQKIDDEVFFATDFCNQSDIEHNNLWQLLRTIGWQDAQELSFEYARSLLKIQKLSVIEVNEKWLWSLQVALV